MKSCLLGIFIFCLLSTSSAQQGGTRKDKLYTMTGIGLSLPVGETSDYLEARISNTMGANLAIGQGSLFLYPKLNLHVFGFNQLLNDAGNPTLIKKGRSTTYLLNLNLGYRHTTGNFSVYGFAGAGGGLILTSRATVTNGNTITTLSNANHWMGTFETGAGIEYKIGSFILFTESSYLLGFKKIEQRTFNSVPVSIGFKTDLSRLLEKK